MEKLNDNQIEQIKRFISSRGFTYIDLQMEILNHISNDILKLINEDSSLNIDDAIKKVHGSYGILGFSKLEDEMQNRLYKKYNNYYWTIVKRAFSLKLIHYLIVGLLMIYFCISSFPVYFVGLYALSCLIFIVWSLIKTSILYKKLKFKRYLSYRVANVYSMGGGLIVFQIFLRFSDYFEKNNYISVYFNGLASIVLVFIALTLFASNSVQKYAIREVEAIKANYNC